MRQIVHYRIGCSYLLKPTSTMSEKVLDFVAHDSTSGQAHVDEAVSAVVLFVFIVNNYKFRLLESIRQN